MMNLLSPACPLCERTNLLEGTNKASPHYLCTTHGWFSRKEIKASMLERIVEDSSPIVPEHHKNLSTQYLANLALSYEKKVKNPLVFGTVKRNDYNLANIAKALTGGYYTKEGKRIWLWGDRVKKAQEFYEKMDYSSLTSDQRQSLGDIMTHIEGNRYLQKKRQDIVNKVYLANRRPDKVATSFIQRQALAVNQDMENLVAKVKESCKKSMHVLHKEKSDHDAKKNWKYYAFLAAMYGALGTGWYYIMDGCKHFRDQNKKQEVVATETPVIVENPKLVQAQYKTPQTFSLALEGKTLEIARKRGLWGLGEYLGVEDGKKNSTIIKFTQDAGAHNYLPNHDKEGDGILYDIWSKENLKNGKLVFSQEMVEKCHLDKTKLQY